MFSLYRISPKRQLPFGSSNLLHHAPINVQAFVEVKLHGLDEHGGFDLLAARDDVLERHAGTDLKTALRDDRAFVQPHRNKMRGDAGDLHALLVSLPIRLRAGKTRQQRRMDVDDLVFVPHTKFGDRIFMNRASTTKSIWCSSKSCSAAFSDFARSCQLRCAKGSLCFLACGAKSA